MMEAGIRGGSLVECEGVLQAIGASRGEKATGVQLSSSIFKPRQRAEK